MARVYFEMNDVPRACTALADSRAAITSTDVELRNQVDYLAQRCPLASAAPPVKQAPALAQPVAPVPDIAPPVQSAVPSPAASTDTASVLVTAVDSTKPGPGTKAPPVRAPVTTPKMPAKTPAPTAAPTDAQRFSVQVAAYATTQEAQRLVKKYRANGYDARVAGSVAPFRVRIGRLKTRAEAVALAKVLKEKSGAAFVVVAEPK
jgi:cell division septation protein DedD